MVKRCRLEGAVCDDFPLRLGEGYHVVVENGRTSCFGIDFEKSL